MDTEEGTFCRFGTPLEPLDEDEVPSKKPIAVEDQIVTDSNGKRRFHGAFTGGFSAGFWNTVGSLEGWKPQSFKSSRAEKAERMSQRPKDFMDEEDLGEFGIAPQRVQTTADFAVEAATSSSELNRKRKLQPYNDGPIPGVPVLHQLLKPSKENIATRLLKKMGWKEGQGVGARQTRKEKKSAAQRNARERYVMKRYGCDMEPEEKVDEMEIKSVADQNDDDSDLSDDEITFAPDDFEPFLCSIKNNAFGLGYAGLSRDPVLQNQHINLFGAFEVMGKDNKKLSIRGQAFGVGALEEEDEDIYERDDMTRYDFSLDGKRKAKVKDKQKQEVGVLEEFQASRNIAIYRKKIFTIIVPAGFKPRNWAVRKTRFEPLDDDRVSLLRTKENYKTRGLGRHDLDPEERGHILGETSKASRGDQLNDESKNKKKTYLERINEKYKQKDKEEESLEELNRIAKKVDNFSKGEVLHETLSLEEAAKIESEKVQADAMKLTKNLDKTSGVFQPFAMNDSKQTRYDNFLQQNLRNDDEITKFLETIQPLNMSDWDREREKKEFIQARNIYRPLKGLMSDRFVSESAVVAERVIAETIKATKKKVEVVRTKSMWKPSANLCKRFNVAEPFGGTMEEKKDRKKPRFSVFDYLETSINSKDNFKTPVMIPTKTEKPKTIVSQTESEQKASARVSSNELFEKAISSSKIEWNRVTESKTVPPELTPKRTNDKKKSPLEKKVEELQAKHPSEKKDLFKAIFDSSSEDESAESQNEAVTKPSAQFLDTEAHNDIFATMKKSAAEINILRNTSPPRGIFANLFAKKSDDIIEKDIEKQVGNLEASATPPNEANKDKLGIPKKIAFKPRNERMKETSVEVVDVYGPKTPMVPSATVLLPETPEKKLDQVDTDLLKLLKKQKKATIVEKWVEKSDSASDWKKKKKNKDRDKKKKSKKHKKDKKKHKDKK